MYIHVYIVFLIVFIAFYTFVFSFFVYKKKDIKIKQTCYITRFFSPASAKMQRANPVACSPQSVKLPRGGDVPRSGNKKDKLICHGMAL